MSNKFILTTNDFTNAVRIQHILYFHTLLVSRFESGARLLLALLRQYSIR